MRAVFTRIENNSNKKKLIAIFGAIIIVGITFLYFENIYNLTHRSKSLFEASIYKTKNKNEIPNTNTKVNNANDNKKVTQTSTISGSSSKNKGNENNNEIFDIKNKPGDSEKNIQNDNKNNDNLTKCWDKEPFVVLEPCHKCSSLLRSSLYACKSTGYREVLNCERYGPVSRSCRMPDTIRIKHYWTFEIICLIFALIFTTIAKQRKRYLDFLATERVRQQILSG